MTDNSSDTQVAYDTASFLDVRRLMLMVVAGILGIVLDFLGLPLFDIHTVSDAIIQFLIIIIGGYLGVTLADMALDKYLGE